MRPEKPSKTELGQRLRAIRHATGNQPREKFAAILGLNIKTVAAYERGERTPDATAMAAYQGRFGASADWLISGNGEMFLGRKSLGAEPFLRDPTETLRRSALPSISGSESNEQMVSIPMYEEINASAGSGDMPLGETPSRMIAFNAQFLRDHGATPSACSIITAKGESMTPAIPDGALLVVDHSQTSVDHGRIYVFNVAEHLMVKRAHWSMTEELTLKSDNPSSSYPDEKFSLHDVDELSVVGRVVLQSKIV